MIALMLKTMFCQYSWTHFFFTEKLFFTCRTTRKLLAFSEVVSLIQCNAAQYDKFIQISSTYNRLQLEITLNLFWRPLLLVISFCIRTVCTYILQCLQELTNSRYHIVSSEFYFLYIQDYCILRRNAVYVTLSKELAKLLYLSDRSTRRMTNAVS